MERKTMKSILIKVYRYFMGNKSEKMLNSLRLGGAKIGKKVVVYSPESVDIDKSRPWLLSIGDYTKITKGVCILTHDYSLSVMRRVYGEWIGEGAETIIGENCFIGVNSILLMGTQLGNNVIVGAAVLCMANFQIMLLLREIQQELFALWKNITENVRKKQ